MGSESAPGNSGERQKAALDLALSLLAFAMCSLLIPYLNPRLRTAHGFRFVFATALYQLCSESLVPVVLLIVRREHFSWYGFRKSRIASSIGLGVLLALLYDAGISVYSNALLWLPLRRQPAIRLSLAAAFPFNLLGICITVVVWGFLEGFFGIYFARKVNVLVCHSGDGWFALGVLAFALFNGSVHVLVGQGPEGFITSFVSGYAMAVVPAITGNAWGGTLVQTLTNAVGKLAR